MNAVERLPANEALERLYAQAELANRQRALAAEIAAPKAIDLTRVGVLGADLGPVRGQIDSLGVADTVRRAGVGTALLDGCRAELGRRGISYWSVGVVEANRRAVQLYERLGFRPWTREMLARVDDTI